MPTLEVTVADGRVESASNGVLTGWAWSPPAPGRRVRVDVYVGGRIVASGLADRHAPGLEKVGIGDGHHAFAIELPAELAEEEELAVAVRVAGIAERLSMLAGWSDQSAGPWSAVRMIVDNEPPPPPPMADDAPSAGPDPAMLALAGREGWLFAHPDNAADAVPLDEVAGRLLRTAEELSALGIRYVVAIAPLKLGVYPDRLLERPAAPPVDACRALERRARDSDVLEILDLRATLFDARRQGDLFLPRDEAWSALGALHVQRALVKRAGLPRLRPTRLAEARFTRSLEAPPDALAAVPVAGPAPDVAPVVPNGIDASALRAERVPAAEHLDAEGQPPARVYERPQSDDLPRVVLLGDPCIHAIVPWLAEVSSRLIVFSTPHAPMVPIELEYPDVVFHVLERRRIAA